MSLLVLMPTTEVLLRLLSLGLSPVTLSNMATFVKEMSRQWGQVSIGSSCSTHRTFPYLPRSLLPFHQPVQPSLLSCSPGTDLGTHLQRITTLL